MNSNNPFRKSVDKKKTISIMMAVIMVISFFTGLVALVGAEFEDDLGSLVIQVASTFSLFWRVWLW